MVFNSISVATFLGPDSLKIITLNRNQSQVLPLQFPNEAVIHQEIVNERLLTECITSFLRSTNLQPQETTLFLTSSLVYMKRIAQMTQDIEQQSQLFFDAVPLDANKVAKKSISYNNDIILTATNERYYQLIVQIFHHLGWKVVYVVPASLFISKETEQNIDPASIRKLLSNTKLLKLCNFLDETPESTHSRTNSKTLFLWCVVFLLILLNVGALGLVLGKIPVPGMLQLKSDNQSQTTQVIRKPVKNPIAIKKVPKTIDIQQDIKIQILNGSGVAGLAASVSAVLKDEGFTEINTGNAAALSKETSIEYTEKANIDTLDVIKKKLETIFDNVSLASAEGEVLNSDVIITTGSRK